MYLIKMCTEVLQMRSPQSGQVRRNRLGMTAIVSDSCLHTLFEL